MRDYKISIIVPVYNVQEFLEHCVDTILNQSYSNLEIVLVDDGSTDDSASICDKYGAGDERVRVIHKENGGLISAWKRGVEESTGEYLCFVDSDDWIDLDMIEQMSQQLTGNQKEIISSDYIIEHQDGRKQYVWQELPPGEYRREDIKKKVIPRLLGNEKRYVCMSRCMKLISRGLIMENRCYSDPEIAMAEDTTIMLPSLIDCHRLVIMNHKAWYHYRYVNTSMAHKYDAGMYENMKKLRTIIKRILKDKFIGLEHADMKLQADKEYLFLLLLAVKNEARGNPTGYRRNILEIAGNEEVRELVAKTSIQVSERSNQLLYYVLRHPSEMTVRMLRLAMIVYYRGK